MVIIEAIHMQHHVNHSHNVISQNSQNDVLANRGEAIIVKIIGLCNDHTQCAAHNYVNRHVINYTARLANAENYCHF